MGLDEKSFQSLDILRTSVLICLSSGKVLYANTSAQTLLGQSAKHLCNKEIREFFSGIENYFELYRKSPDSNFLIQSELLDVLIHSGESSSVFVTVHPHPLDSGYLIVEAESAEKTLRLGHERHMAELSENTRRLLRNLAHEVKNPLGGIRGAAQLLKAELQSPVLEEYTDVIISEADRLQLLVDKLLAPYRRAFVPALLNIHEILEHVRFLVASEFSELISFERDYDISVPLVFGDKDQLTQVFLNLVRNAAEALCSAQGKKEGTITLRTRVVHHVLLADEPVRTALNVHVIDNGPGIPPEILDTVFYPLVTGKDQGSGLGLSLVQAFVERHRGSVTVTSEKHKTDFSIYLPLQNEKRLDS